MTTIQRGSNDAVINLFISDPKKWNPKSELHTMEIPFLAISKKIDIEPRHYKSSDGKSAVSLMPTAYGIPTIWDKDLLLYVETLIRDAMSRGVMGEENRAIQIDSWNFLDATVRGDGMQQYKGLRSTLRRLASCYIETNIETDGKITTEAFNLIQRHKIIAETRTGKIASIEIKLCDWLYRAIWNMSKEMLSINRDYFKLKGGIERRLYELARKHCGNQPYWKVGIPVLWDKSGSKSTLRDFRHKVFEGQGDLGTIPDYRVSLLPKTDQVIFYSKHHRKPIQAVVDAHKLSVD